MSATVTAPTRQVGAQRGTVDVRRTQEGGRRRPWSTDAAATVALAGFSAAVAAGFARVFSGWEFFDNLLVIVLAGHGTGMLLRRLVRGAIAFPLMVIVLGWLVVATAYRPTLGLLWQPTAETWEVLTGEFALVREQFRTAVAPVPFDLGWDLLAAAGIAAVVLLADTFAFRAFARAEALVPGGVLFVFVAALGADRLRVALSVLLVATGVVATIALRAHHLRTTGRSRPMSRPAGRRQLLAAVLVGTVVAGGAGVIGPRLPGADAEPLYETKGGGGGGGVTDVLSPLVDIRSRLTNRSNSEMFVVRADTPAYWRSSALIEFDGTRWGLPERDLRTASGELSTSLTRSVEIRQLIRIVSLGGVLVPAAADPIAASGNDGNIAGDLRWNPESSTLVAIDDELTDGDVFEIVSAAPQFDPQTLANASSTDAGDPVYTELPGNFPQSVRDAAEQVTNGVATPYGKALALQDWFRSEFSYSLEVQAGHGGNAMEAFLRSRIGYCEQFAGTYAAMMRSLGYPSRVAVGFTSGIEESPGVFSVLGKNAHAWPEVWFDGLGWVPFEPTPGRGAPGAEEYTGVAEAQDVSGVDPDAPRATLPADAPTTTLFPNGDANIPNPLDEISQLEDALGGPSSAAEAAGGQSDGSGDGLGVGGLALPLFLLAVIVLMTLAPLVSRTLRRRTHLGDPHAQLTHIWRRSVEALETAGLTHSETSTPLEYAARVDHAFPVIGGPALSLAQELTKSTYAEETTVDDATLRRCEQWCTEVERATADDLKLSTRLARHFTTWR